MSYKNGTTLAVLLSRCLGREPVFHEDPKNLNDMTKNQKRYTVLMSAVDGNHAGVVRVLLVRGAVDAKNDDYHYTALMWAAENGHTDLVRLLLARGADVNASDEWGASALKLADLRGHKDVARLLKQAGATRERD